MDDEPVERTHDEVVAVIVDTFDAVVVDEHVPARVRQIRGIARMALEAIGGEASDWDRVPVRQRKSFLRHVGHALDVGMTDREVAEALLVAPIPQGASPRWLFSTRLLELQCAVAARRVHDVESWAT